MLHAMADRLRIHVATRVHPDGRREVVGTAIDHGFAPVWVRAGSVTPGREALTTGHVALTGECNVELMEVTSSTRTGRRVRQVVE